MWHKLEVTLWFVFGSLVVANYCATTSYFITTLARRETNLHCRLLASSECETAPKISNLVSYYFEDDD
jgi:hypothetical protein